MEGNLDADDLIQFPWWKETWLVLAYLLKMFPLWILKWPIVYYTGQSRRLLCRNTKRFFILTVHEFHVKKKHLANVFLSSLISIVGWKFWYISYFDIKIIVTQCSLAEWFVSKYDRRKDPGNQNSKKNLSQNCQHIIKFY